MFMYRSSPTVQQAVDVTDSLHNRNPVKIYLERIGAPKKFIVSTKAPGFKTRALAKQSIIDGMNSSLKQLSVSSVCKCTSGLHVEC